MKYCINGNTGIKYRKMCNEIRYFISEFNQAIQFARDYSDKKIIISIPTLNDVHCPNINKLYTIHKEIKNIYYEFQSLSDLIKYVKDNQLLKNINEDRHYMFGQPVISWAMVMILRYYKVSDILIAEPLTFNMENIKKGIKDEGISVRVNPALSKHNYALENTNDPSINHFWIIPEYVYLYEDYIDVLELSDESVSRQETLCRTYINYDTYGNNLKFLIKNFDIDIIPNVLDEKFFKRRLNCNQTCLISSQNCHYCSTFAKFNTQIKQIISKKES